MKHVVRKIMEYLLRGILWGCAFFVFFGLFTYYLQGKDFLLSIMEAYPKHAVGTMLVGIGYGSTSIVYGWERPSLFAKVGLHFFVGTGIFFAVAHQLSWIPLQSNRYFLWEFLISCASFAVMWSLFYLFSRKEAGTINKRLKEISKG